MSDTDSVTKSWFASVIGVGKDFVALLRDAALFVLALLLVAFPVQFNSILVDAGFEEGSIVGFKWQANTKNSINAFANARSTISKLRDENDRLLKALNDAYSKLNDPSQTDKFLALEKENKKLKDETTKVQSEVSNAIEESAALVNKTRVPAWRKSISRDDILARKFELQAYDALINKDFQLALSLFVAAENASNGFNCVYEWGKLLRDRQNLFSSMEGQKSIIKDAPEKVCTTYVPQELREKLKAISQ